MFETTGLRSTLSIGPVAFIYFAKYLQSAHNKSTSKYSIEVLNNQAPIYANFILAYRPETNIDYVCFAFLTAAAQILMCFNS